MLYHLGTNALIESQSLNVIYSEIRCIRGHADDRRRPSPAGGRVALPCRGTIKLRMTISATNSRTFQVSYYALPCLSPQPLAYYCL